MSTKKANTLLVVPPKTAVPYVFIRCAPVINIQVSIISREK